MAIKGTHALLANLCAGSGVGALVGLILGLSASPVASTVLGSLSTGLLVLLGLSASRNEQTAPQQSVTVAAFGLSCTILLLTGVYLRSHNLLAPSLDEQDRRLQSVFHDAAERDRILLLQNYGLLPQNDQPIASNAGTAPVQRDSSSTMVATDASTQSRAAVPQSVPLAGTTPAAGYLRNGIADACSYSQRKKFANLQAYLSFLHRTDIRLAALIEAQPQDIRDRLSYNISDYLCP